MKRIRFTPIFAWLGICAVIAFVMTAMQADAVPYQPGTTIGGQFNVTPLVMSDGQTAMMQLDGSGNQKVVVVGGTNVPATATQLSASSGNVAAATATATLTGQAAKTTYITGFQITFGGATAALCVTATVTGTIATAPSYAVCAPAGVAVQGTPLVVNFPQPLASSAQNTNIVVSLPSLGTGNTNTVVNAQGYVQ